jgi:hypothetical protein
MARLAGRTKSWVWWMAGLLCALIWGQPAGAGTPIEPIQPPYGVRPIRRGPPKVKPEDRKKAEKLVDEYMSPVPATKPIAEARTKIDKLIKDFGSEASATRRAASQKVIEFGAGALEALRKAVDSKDAEVSTRAKSAITRIEKAAREKIVTALKKNVNAAVAVIGARRKQAGGEYRVALKAENEARKAEDKDAEKAARLKRVAAGKRSSVLMMLSGRVSPRPAPMPAPVYGVRVMKAQ